MTQYEEIEKLKKSLNIRTYQNKMLINDIKVTDTELQEALKEVEGKNREIASLKSRIRYLDGSWKK